MVIWISVSAKIWLWTQNLPVYGYLDKDEVTDENINSFKCLGVEEYDNRMVIVIREEVIGLLMSSAK